MLCTVWWSKPYSLYLRMLSKVPPSYNSSYSTHSASHTQLNWEQCNMLSRPNRDENFMPLTQRVSKKQEDIIQKHWIIIEKKWNALYINLSIAYLPLSWNFIRFVLLAVQLMEMKGVVLLLYLIFTYSALSRPIYSAFSTWPQLPGWTEGLWVHLAQAACGGHAQDAWASQWGNSAGQDMTGQDTKVTTVQ